MAKIHVLRELTKEELEKVSDLRFNAATSTLKKRAMVIFAVAKGELQNKQIAENIGVSEDNITDTVKGFNNEGMNYLIVNKYANNTHVLDPFVEEIEKDFNNAPPSCLDEAVVRIEKLTGIYVCKNSLRKWLKKEHTINGIKKIQIYKIKINTSKS